MQKLFLLYIIVKDHAHRPKGKPQPVDNWQSQYSRYLKIREALVEGEPDCTEDQCSVLAALLTARSSLDVLQLLQFVNSANSEMVRQVNLALGDLMDKLYVQALVSGKATRYELNTFGLLVFRGYAYEELAS